MTAPAVLFVASSVAFVRSPRYLAEKIADAVDERLPEARDEARFWTSVRRAWELTPGEMPALQARIAAKYCRNLDLWQALPRLRARTRVVLLHTGSRLVFDCWREAYRPDSAFDALLVPANGLIWRDPELYTWAAAQLGAEPSVCAAADPTARGVEAAEQAGLRAYRYGTAYGLLRWLDR